MTPNFQVISTIPAQVSANVPFIDDARDINLPNDNSFAVFGAGKALTNDLIKIINQVILEEKAEQSKSVYIQFYS